MTNVTRRSILGWLGTIYLGVAAGVPASAFAESVERRAASALISTLSRPSSARIVGKHCLDHAHGGDINSMVLSIASEIGLTPGTIARIGGDDLRRRLGRQIRADFSGARIVSVDGWVLSKTEARLYALIATAV